ncbi:MULTISPECIES: hypothetical protein [Halobacterium]|uniref:Uncharacterized protein n=1 Tax=Halobacterium salinarum (strain ATCC 33171 / DSM 3754 / JCM 8978 / NBRC 102687 / NCIMB 764 / 91-R6) TaxID=2597657 RepID=A0A4D6GSE6_HALS9|nr:MULTISPECIES: hypothetical protein [Halobacterium]MCF2208496.1 hypothetical protein [Halobacterium salinarum]MDL0120353.1 hypothetical protein [Halobacterium salinarum]MDL0121555.1 hypothetical protein [Halobacterium salinarum]MDL0134899.1 hypothetical protein [Halobacterium salinarum]MDL0138133.1 hypothetical protein [Halobacterium salinarum]
MQTETEKRVVRIGGLLLVPVLAFVLFVGAETFDGGIVGTALIVAVPMVVYAAGLHFVLKGVSDQTNGQDASPT